MYFEETPFAAWIVIGVLVLLLLAAAGTIAYLVVEFKGKGNIRCDASDGVKIAESGACVAIVKGCEDGTTLQNGYCVADDAGGGKSGKKLGAGAVAGIAIGSAMGAAILALTVNRALYPDGAVAEFGNSMFSAGSRAASSMYETARASVRRRTQVAPYEEFQETDDEDSASEY